MQLVFTPVWGRLSDRLGRRPILILGLILTAISYVMFGMAHSLEMLFLSRLLGGVGGANISAAQAYISDVTVITSYSIHYTKLYETCLLMKGPVGYG